MMCYYDPENTMIFRVRPMSGNRVQHQKGLSDDGFEQRYPDEEACRKAWFAWRWPEGFKCPRCASTKYSQIQGRQLLQCRRCRYQTSLIAGTVVQGTKLPMRVWFRAMHLLAQGKKGISSIELGRRLGISANAAWRVQYKLMQAMLERDRRYKLGAAGPRIEIDDAYIGGERTGEGSGRGRRGHTPFIVAIETSDDGRPLHARLQVVRGFQAGETKRLCFGVEAGFKASSSFERAPGAKEGSTRSGHSLPSRRHKVGGRKLRRRTDGDAIRSARAINGR